MWDAGKWYSIASVFFGLIAVALSMIFFISFPASILAITFGALAIRKYYRKTGTTAITLGVIGIIITIVIFVSIVNALNVDSIVAGKWRTNNGQLVEFSDKGSYVWYPEEQDVDYYTSGYYNLSTGMYKAKTKYVMGYTVKLEQNKVYDDSKVLNEKEQIEWLLYKNDNEENKDRYEMMNMKTGQLLTLEKEKNKFLWFSF